MQQGKNALSGVRVVDLGWWGVGAVASRTLADFGAEVIKIEDTIKPDPTRRLAPFAGQTNLSYPVTTVPASPNVAGYFNNGNRNKLGATLDLRLPKGREVFKRLISISDVVMQNFRPGIMEGWGLDYETLAKVKPDIIYIAMCGLGQTGPERDYGTLGPIVQALCGITFLSGFPGKMPAGWGYSYMDNTGGYYATMAVLLALYHRNRTGRGQFIDQSAVEVGATLLGTTILDFTVNQRPSRRAGMPPGNRSLHPAVAPHGVYRCKGEDRWCAIAVFTDQEWEALCKAIGEPAWTREPRFASMLARVRHQDELDQLLESWTQNHSHDEIMQSLQQVGICCGAVRNGQDLSEGDPQLKERGLFEELEHPEIGWAKFEGIPMKSSALPGKLRRAAPLLGQDNEYVYKELLGMSEDEYESCAREGVFGSQK